MKTVIKAALLFALPAIGMAAPLHVVTTIPDLADIAKTVGGANVEIYCLASGMEDPHNVLMKPSMVSKLAQADLFIELGLDLEHAYAPPLLQESRNLKIQPGKPGYLDCSRGITVRDVPKSLDRSEGDVHPNGNPHYNLDPVRMKGVAAAIATRLAELDGTNAAAYQGNAKAFEAKIEAKLSQWRGKLGGKSIKFVSYHPDLVYFAERFGMEQVGTIQPKPGIEPGPKAIEDLIGRMKQQDAKLILKESFYSDRLPKQIAAATGARLVSIPIMVHGTREATDYIAMIDAIVSAIAAGTP